MKYHQLRKLNAQLKRTCKDILKYPDCNALYKDLVIIQNRINVLRDTHEPRYVKIECWNNRGEIFKKHAYVDNDGYAYSKSRKNSGGGEFVSKARFWLGRKLEKGMLHSAN